MTISNLVLTMLGILLPLLIGGCAAKLENTPTTNPQQSLLFQKGEVLQKSGRFNEAIQAYKEAIAKDPKSELAADAQYQIGSIYTDTNNPGRDYTIAVREFNKYIENYPSAPRTREATNWIFLIKDYHRLIQRIKDLTDIDVELERKRKRIK